MIVAGGPAAVSDAVTQALAGDGYAVTRLYGPTRFETALAVADHAAAGGSDPSRVWLASGTNWPDALASGPAVAADGGVLVLVDGRGLERTPAVAGWLAARRPARLTLLGGSAAIGTDAEDDLRAVVGAC